MVMIKILIKSNLYFHFIKKIYQVHLFLQGKFFISFLVTHQSKFVEVIPSK